MVSPGAPDRFAAGASRALQLPRGLVVAFREARVDVADLAGRCGLEPGRLDGPQPTFSPAELGLLFERLFSPPAPPSLGLAIGERVQPELFGVLGLTALSAATFGAAVERCARYKRLLGELRLEVEPRGGAVAVRVDLPGAGGPAAHGRVDVELAFLVSFGRRLAVRRPALCQVQLRRPRPAAPEDYARFFQCPVRFGEAVNEALFERASFEAPLLAADPEAHRLLADVADRQLQARGDRLLERARAAVADLLPEGPPRLAAVARRLGCSERSLQRDLQRQGTSFNQLVEQTRRAHALRLLEEGRLEIAEVSYLLGFAHLSSFYRAFERWAGQSPAAYAAAQRQARR